MTPALRERPGQMQDTVLGDASAMLEVGRVDVARELAQSVLSGAGSDLHLQARALSFLAHCDRLASRLRRASEASWRAAQLFEQLGDAEGEANARMTLAHVCMLLGRNDEAVEAALLCVRLCETKPNAQALLAHNCLALAYSWSGDHDRADASFETAVDIARRCEPVISIYQPRLNQIWVEASRLLDERYQTGAMLSLERLEALDRECRELEQAGLGLSVLPGMQSMGRTIALASKCLVAAWRRDFPAAREAIETATRSLSGVITWLDSFVRWGAAELAWAQGDWARAENELIQMRELALAVEHEQLACRAHLLLAQVFELQGKNDEARREHRSLRRRERRVVAEGLSGRESLVSWRLGARQSERHLKQALVESRQFERWSLEDALTGIANRRHFEQSLAALIETSARADRPLTLAMVDVDRFKSVNDRFSHQVGDRVLKTLAAIMTSQVREHDLPARWAGDEFVVLFDDATEEVAAQVCERMQLAVASFDWESIAPGLRMSVSIGLSEARAGDTAESLLQRSDVSMYHAKPLRPAASYSVSEASKSSSTFAPFGS